MVKFCFFTKKKRFVNGEIYFFFPYSIDLTTKVYIMILFMSSRLTLINPSISIQGSVKKAFLSIIEIKAWQK